MLSCQAVANGRTRPQAARVWLCISVCITALQVGAARSITGWSDCISNGPPPANAIQRAWRRMALTSHPDKTDGGPAATDSTTDFMQQSDTKLFLKDSMRYRLHQLLKPASATTLSPFDEAAGGRFSHVHAGGHMRDGWPHLNLRAQVTATATMPPDACWMPVRFGYQQISHSALTGSCRLEFSMAVQSITKETSATEATVSAAS
jgi:hypothetical protein